MNNISIWLSVDPMSDKYPSMSPYNYCANNPVILVDPDGEDELQVNLEGFVSKVPNTENVPDVLFVIDENGNRKTDKNGTILSHIVDRSTMESSSQVKNEGTSVALGEGKCEESAAIGYEVGDKVVDAIGTSHRKKETTPLTNWRVLYFKHSHPNEIDEMDGNLLHFFTSPFRGGNSSGKDNSHKDDCLENKNTNLRNSQIPFTIRFNGRNYPY